MKTVTFDMSAPVPLVGLVLCNVNAKTSWLVMPPPLFTQFSVVLPFCVIVGNVAIDNSSLSLICREGGELVHYTMDEIVIRIYAEAGPLSMCRSQA
jgi:hypothetical protein